MPRSGLSASGKYARLPVPRLRRDRLLALVTALGFAAIPGGPFPWAEEPGESCFYCGMFRRELGHSWMRLEYPDGPAVGFCSLHCASIHLVLDRGRRPRRILVSDYGSRTLVDAATAVWVVGGDRPGVMTARAKWAFGARAEAEGFVARHGGAIADFDRALEAAFEDMYRDIQVIEDRRTDRRLRRGGVR